MNGFALQLIEAKWICWTTTKELGYKVNPHQTQCFQLVCMVTLHFSMNQGNQ